MKTRIVPKRDYLTGHRVWSLQEWIGNEFCGHWHEISWSVEKCTL